MKKGGEREREKYNFAWTKTDERDKRSTSLPTKKII